MGLTREERELIRRKIDEVQRDRTKRVGNLERVHALEIERGVERAAIERDDDREEKNAFRDKARRPTPAPVCSWCGVTVSPGAKACATHAQVERWHRKIQSPDARACYPEVV